jgi:murein DD-endopeptidase MepM/ murein hydrolase activator NlpD
MKNIAIIFLLLSVYSFSCGSTVRDIFGNRTPHEKYAGKLDNRGLDKTPEGRAWLAASKAALETPLTVSLPYRQQGAFHADKPRALGLQFDAKAGQKLTFNLSKKGSAALPLYADIFRAGNTASPLLSVDTTGTQFSLDITEAGSYVLRLQPELYQSGEYALSVSVGPMLGFPVSGKANVGSVWGDARDGGKRRHEGIDIFAPKHAPAVAAADGLVVGVREGGIGGKTVWFRPDGLNMTLYYAHLDKHLVQEGQRVQKGEVLGLVGNTGNAATTPPHLHFGIYTWGGAVDPLPYVNKNVRTAPAVADKKLTTQLKLTKAHKSADGSLLKAATQLVPLAANAKGYVAEAPDGSLLQVPFASVQTTREPILRPNHVAIAATPEEKKS